MDGEYTVEYLGCSILAKATSSGLGSIQKPLREKYIEYRKNSKNKRQSQEVGLRVNRDGLTVTFPVSRPGQANQMFYDFPSINFFEAVRFVAVKGPDKKMVAAFVPIDQNRAPTSGSDRLFTLLDKKHHNLLKLQHPTMLACVMRRTSGVKALECHCFVTENDHEAIRIVSFLGSLQHGGLEREPSYGNRYGPGPDRDGMYGGYDRSPDPDIVRRDHVHNIDNRPPYDQRYSDGWEGPPIRRDSDEIGEDRYMGDSPRHNFLRQKDLNYDRPPYREEPNERPNRLSGDRGGSGNQFRNMNRLSAEDIPPYRDPNSRPNRLSGEEGKGFHHERQRSGDSGNRYSEERVYHHERQRSDEGRIYHERQRSGEINRGERPDEGRIFHERQRSDEFKRGNRHPIENPPHDRERYSRPQGRDDGQGRIPRVLSPGRNRDQPVIKPSRALSPNPRPTSPRSPGLPRQQFNQPQSPQYSPRTEPFFSASNLESRQLQANVEKEQKQKPVAKVPPHLVAGVKVLPTGLLAALPKKAEAEPTRYGDYSDEEDPYDNALSRKEFYARKNVKSDGHRYDSGRNEPERDYQKQGPGGYAPPDILPHHEKGQYWGENERNQKSEDMYRKNSGNRGPTNNRYSEPISENNNKPWSFDSEMKKYSKTKSDDDYDRYNPNDRESNELSEMFNKIGPHRVGDEGPSMGHTNFEEGLGYLP